MEILPIERNVHLGRLPSWGVAMRVLWQLNLLPTNSHNGALLGRHVSATHCTRFSLAVVTSE